MKIWKNIFILEKFQRYEIPAKLDREGILREDLYEVPHIA